MKYFWKKREKSVDKCQPKWYDIYVKGTGKEKVPNKKNSMEVKKMNEKMKAVWEAANYELNLEREYRMARKEGKSDEILAKIKADAEAHDEMVCTWDHDWIEMYNFVKQQIEVGNEMIDFRDLNREESVPAILSMLKSFGVEKFTFSSTWSSSVNIAWKLVELGCKIEGMTKVYTPYRDFESGEYEMAPAYIFSVG